MKNKKKKKKEKRKSKWRPCEFYTRSSPLFVILYIKSSFAGGPLFWMIWIGQHVSENVRFHATDFCSVKDAQGNGIEKEWNIYI